MIRKFLLPLLAVALLCFAIYHVVQAQQTKPKAEPPVTPAQTPFAKTVAGAGIVEAQTENILVGTPVPGVVSKVYVQVGQKVEVLAPLFELDDRPLRAEWQLRKANLESAEAQLKKLEAMPRPEELPPSEAKVREAQANLTDQEDQLKRARVLSAQRAVGEEELVRREQAFRVAQQQYARAKAEYDLLKAGAWEADKAVARAAVDQARAQLGQTETDLKRLKVRTWEAGEVLQVNVRPGEYAGSTTGQALVVIGNLHRLHVRVDIDEHDIPRFKPGTPAVATLRGNPQLKYPLTFVRVEPYVVPKRSLTGDNTERVDTRVLQVIYAVEDGPQKLYVGQQVDVFIDSEKQGYSPGQ